MKNRRKKQNNSDGFTLIELLIVIAIVAILATVAFINYNPLKYFQDARNAQRWTDINSIGEAISLYQIDNNGNIPLGIDENWRMLGTSITGCDIDCGSNTTFNDNTSSDFSSGSYSDTQWDSVNSWVELTSTGQTNGTGAYTSSVKDSGLDMTWSTLSWVPERPTGKQLPGNISIKT